MSRAVWGGMYHGGTWAGDYVLNVMRRGSLKAREAPPATLVDDGRVLALGEVPPAISVAGVVASLTRDVTDFPVPGVEDSRTSPRYSPSQKD